MRPSFPLVSWTEGKVFGNCIDSRSLASFLSKNGPERGLTTVLFNP